MPINDFKVFDETSSNTLTQEEYENSLSRINGVQSGVAESALYNKSIRQLSIMVNAIVRAMESRGIDIVEDDVDLYLKIKNYISVQPLSYLTFMQSMIAPINTAMLDYAFGKNNEVNISAIGLSMAMYAWGKGDLVVDYPFEALQGKETLIKVFSDIESKNEISVNANTMALVSNSPYASNIAKEYIPFAGDKSTQQGKLVNSSGGIYGSNNKVHITDTMIVEVTGYYKMNLQVTEVLNNEWTGISYTVMVNDVALTNAQMQAIFLRKGDVVNVKCMFGENQGYLGLMYLSLTTAKEVNQSLQTVVATDNLNSIYKTFQWSGKTVSSGAIDTTNILYTFTESGTIKIYISGFCDSGRSSENLRVYIGDLLIGNFGDMNEGATGIASPVIRTINVGDTLRVVYRNHSTITSKAFIVLASEGIVSPYEVS